MTSADAAALLAAQRLRRPVSPHLGVYKMDQTWFGGSAWHRMTGAALSGGLVYCFFAAYVVAPLAGLHLGSASLAAAFGSLPLAVKAAAKFAVAWPFAFHCINGARHIVFDMGLGFSRSAIRSGGWAVWAVSLLGSVYLALFF